MSEDGQRADLDPIGRLHPATDHDRMLERAHLCTRRLDSRAVHFFERNNSHGAERNENEERAQDNFSGEHGVARRLRIYDPILQQPLFIPARESRQWRAMVFAECNHFE